MVWQENEDIRDIPLAWYFSPREHNDLANGFWAYRLTFGFIDGSLLFFYLPHLGKNCKWRCLGQFLMEPFKIFQATALGGARHVSLVHAVNVHWLMSIVYK